MRRYVEFEGFRRVDIFGISPNNRVSRCEGKGITTIGIYRAMLLY